MEEQWQVQKTELLFILKNPKISIDKRILQLNMKTLPLKKLFRTYLSRHLSYLYLLCWASKLSVFRWSYNLILHGFYLTYFEGILYTKVNWTTLWKLTLNRFKLFEKTNIAIECNSYYCKWMWRYDRVDFLKISVCMPLFIWECTVETKGRMSATELWIPSTL